MITNSSLELPLPFLMMGESILTNYFKTKPISELKKLKVHSSLVGLVIELLAA